MERIELGQLELEEKVVYINRVAKVVKGGRRFQLSAIVVVGDGNGHVGFGFGKGKEVPVAIQKGIQDAKKNIFKVALAGSTIPHQVVGRYGAGQVLLKPASEGTGLIAGGCVRAVLELAGVRDILTKSIGSANAINVVQATVAGLKSLKQPEKVAALRGKTVEEITGFTQPKVEKEEVNAVAEVKETAEDRGKAKAKAKGAAKAKVTAKPAAKAEKEPAKPAAKTKTKEAPAEEAKKDGPADKTPKAEDKSAKKADAPTKKTTGSAAPGAKKTDKKSEKDSSRNKDKEESKADK